MEAGGGGAPPRASGTRQVARYGLRWRARDAAHQAAFWARRASFAELVGTFYVTGAVVLACAVWASGAQDNWDYLAPVVALAAGAVLLVVARLRGWRR